MSAEAETRPTSQENEDEGMFVGDPPQNDAQTDDRNHEEPYGEHSNGQWQESNGAEEVHDHDDQGDSAWEEDEVEPEFNLENEDDNNWDEEQNPDSENEDQGEGELEFDERSENHGNLEEQHDSYSENEHEIRDGEEHDDDNAFQNQEEPISSEHDYHQSEHGQRNEMDPSDVNGEQDEEADASLHDGSLNAEWNKVDEEDNDEIPMDLKLHFVDGRYVIEVDDEEEQKCANGADDEVLPMAWVEESIPEKLSQHSFSEELSQNDHETQTPLWNLVFPLAMIIFSLLLVVYCVRRRNRLKENEKTLLTPHSPVKKAESFSASTTPLHASLQRSYHSESYAYSHSQKPPMSPNEKFGGTPRSGYQSSPSWHAGRDPIRGRELSSFSFSPSHSVAQPDQWTASPSSQMSLDQSQMSLAAGESSSPSVLPRSVSAGSETNPGRPGSSMFLPSAQSGLNRSGAFHRTQSDMQLRQSPAPLLNNSPTSRVNPSPIPGPLSRSPHSPFRHPSTPEASSPARHYTDHHAALTGMVQPSKEVVASVPVRSPASIHGDFSQQSLIGGSLQQTPSSPFTRANPVSPQSHAQ